MMSWLGAKLVRHTMKELNAGNIKPTLRMDARDVELTFPGPSSFSGVYKGKKEIRTWLERFVQIGVQIFADEVILKGLPWRQTVCVRGHDHVDSPDGERVYENRYVIWGQLRCGEAQALRGLRGHTQAGRARRVAGASRAALEGRLMPRTACRLADAFPHVRLDEVPDSYVLMPIDRPEVLARELGDFISGE